MSGERPLDSQIAYSVAEVFTVPCGVVLYKLVFSPLVGKISPVFWFRTLS